MVEKFMKVVVAAGIAGGVLAAGCLTRPVVSEDPTTKTSFQAQVKQQSIDKVDILFAIDNSASMGDKQDLLALAVPILVDRLLNPNCVSTDANKTCATAGDCSSLGAGAQCDTSGNGGKGQCYVAGDNGGGDNQCKSITGTKPEFAPVHDMHVGIVSSSLGSGGGDVCATSGSDPTHQNDQGHLLNRTVGSPEGSIANAKPVSGDGGNFLAWLPASDPKNAGKSPPNVTPYGNGQETNLVGDFKSLISGVQQAGCGLEAQLESWYRFLVQPDPYNSLDGGNGSAVTYKDVDATLLKERHDFLRPDSLVAIIQLTDEEDSWSDPRWGSGFGWATRSNTFPGGPSGGVGPRETSACDGQFNPNNPTTWGPNSPNCTSCAFQGTSGDPNCQSCAPGATTCPAKGWYSPASTTTPITAVDGLNVRYGEQYMMTRYGLDPQYDIQRYVDGLRSTTVPDRDHEDDNGASSSVGHYAPIKNCTNPLFADSLPDGSDTSSGALCQLKLGSRTPDLVFYAIIGGVPNSLINDANGNLKLDLTSGDWEKILGHDPAHYDQTGIDPHMIESLAPRAGLPTAGASYNLGSDPDNGREWNTLTSEAYTDLQFACTFTLPTPRDCSGGAGSCDCGGPNGATSDPAGPPLCDVANRSSQVKGKAYPTIRELRVAKGLGQQSVVASLCAKNVTNQAAPDFGYNGAMQAIVNRLKSALAGQCLPQTLTRGGDGTVPCLILVVYPNQTDQAAGCTDPGMTQPDPSVVKRYDDQFIAGLGDAGTSQQPPVVCQFQQLSPSLNCTGANCYNGPTCDGSPNVGWCYVEGSANTGGCAQAIKFGGSGPPAGTTVDLECIEQSGAADAGTD